MAKRVPQPCSPENCGDNYPLCGRAGTYSGKRGCRCDPCYAAKLDENRRYRERHREVVLQRARDAYREKQAENVERARRYREVEREAIAARLKAKREANLQFFRDRERGYYEKTPKAVIRQRRRRYYEENREEIKERARLQREARSKAERERDRISVREWKRANKERNRLYDVKRRALTLAGGGVKFSYEHWLQKKAYWGNKCYLQLEGCTGGDESVDHVKPLTTGSVNAHMLCNLRPACMPCNSRKHNKWPYPAPPGPPRRLGWLP